jgi:hypothetical protein
MKSRK